VNGGTCYAHSTGYFCSCLNGTTGDQCEKQTKNPCASSPCQNNAICLLAYKNDFVCLCRDGWTGKECNLNINKMMQYQLAHPCASTPCLNDGKCATRGASYFCECKNQTTGVNCETVINAECIGYCKNGGTCQGDSVYVLCMCPKQWKGLRCETPFSQKFEDKFQVESIGSTLVNTNFGILIAFINLLIEFIS
jgi:EGF-like domain/Human growth factor-like EGF